jgi:murein DD-endopeptidase MepM/ murein hydrolase activator NlpD
MFRKIGILVIALTINVFAIEVVDGFDYPFSNKGYNDNKEITIQEHITKLSKYKEWKTTPCKELNNNLDKNLIYTNFNKYKDCVYQNHERWNSVKPKGKGVWYNVNDVGDYVSTFGGLHPGEDWNAKNNADLGTYIYSIANGEVYKLISDGSDTETIIVKHKLSKIEGFVYSIYTHINVLSQITINGKTETLKEGTKVNRGTKIATIKNVSAFADHLHFSMVYLKGIYTYLEYDRDNGYFSNFGKQYFNPMNKEKVQFAINLLKTSGYLDPSDFIEAHRPSNVRNNTKSGYETTLNSHLSTNQSDFSYFNFNNTIHYTLRDNTLVKNNQNIMKIWRLKNIGIDVWDSNYYLKYVGKEKGAYFDELRTRKWHLYRKVFPNTNGLLCADMLTDVLMSGKKLYFKLFNGKNREIKRVNGKSNSFYFQVKVQGNGESKHISYKKNKDLLYPKLTKDEAKNLIIKILNIDISDKDYYKNLDENQKISKYTVSELLFQVARKKNKDFVDDVVSHVRIQESGIVFDKSILGSIFYVRNTEEIERTTKLTNTSSYIYAQKFVLGSVLFPIKRKDDNLYWSKEMRYINFKNAVEKLKERLK